MDVLQRFAAGDVDAFEALFRAYQSDVFRWVLRIVRDRAAAEDLTVETFWRVYHARARFNPSREFGAWARRISTNAAIDYLKSRRPFAELREIADPGGLKRGGDAQHELGEALRQAFAELPPKLQAAATLALIEGEPQAEIAAALGISVNGVKSRVFRAVRLLRKRMIELGFGPCTTMKTKSGTC